MVQELFDAGLEAPHCDPILEAIRSWPQKAALGVGSGVAPRLAAIVRVAQRLDAEAEAGDPATLGQAMKRAVEILSSNGTDALPCRVLVFLGFSDATGRIADLIQAARSHLGAVVAIEMPANPVAPHEVDPGVEFASAFHARFGGQEGLSVGEGQTPDTLDWFVSEDPHGEARSVAMEVRRAISLGTSPEDIGVVVRAIRGWSSALRRALAGSGVPYSGVECEGLGHQASRRMTAIAACLEAGTDALAGTWVSASGAELDARARLAFDSLGVRVVGDIPERLDPDTDMPLDVRLGIVVREGAVNLPRARLYASEAAAIHRRAKAFAEAIRSWPVTASPERHHTLLKELLRSGLSVDDDSAALTAIDGLLAELADCGPIRRSEWVRMAAQAIRLTASTPIGGAGGGVAILDATEARGRTFERLFVMGLNRGEFPRLVREDPLVPDAARQALGEFLPDLRQKRLGVHEERFLFAQLLASSPHVTLSCSRSDAQGAPQHMSSLLVDLQLHKVLGEPKRLDGGERPDWEVAVSRGLGGADASDVFDERHAPLRDLVALRTGKNGIQWPYMGQVGPPIFESDPRHKATFVTTVEAIARCPWRALLEKHLGVQGRADPYGSLPAVEGQLLGRVVHLVIERVVRASLSTESAHEPADAQPLVWPSDATLSEWIVASAETCLKDDGVGWLGFARAAVPPALAALSVLREFDSTLDGVWGAEQEFAVALESGVVVSFKADRLDLRDGLPVLTDFKLGKPPTVHKKPETRRIKLLDAVRQGRLLQGAMYSRALPEAAGQYLYIKGDLEAPERSFVFSHDDPEVSTALEAIVGEVHAAVQEGSYFPRVSELKDDKVPVACGYCSVRETCLVEDSSLRMALIDRMSQAPRTSTVSRLWRRGEGEADDE